MKYLTEEHFLFTEDVDKSIIQSIINIITLSDDEYLGFDGFFNVKSILFQRTVFFTEGVSTLLKKYISENEDRANIQDIVIEKIDDYSFNIIIYFISNLTGRKYTIEHTVKGL